VLYCYVSRIYRCDFGLGSVYGVPGLILVVWCGRFCLEGLFGLCSYVGSSVCCVFVCNVPCGCTHAVIGFWGVVPLCLCLAMVRSVHMEYFVLWCVKLSVLCVMCFLVGFALLVCGCLISVPSVLECIVCLSGLVLRVKSGFSALEFALCCVGFMG